MGGIAIFIIVATLIVGAAIAGFSGPVPSAAFKWGILQTGFRLAVMLIPAFLKILAVSRIGIMMAEDEMLFVFLADSGLILADCCSNFSFLCTVSYSGFNHDTLVKS